MWSEAKLGCLLLLGPLRMLKTWYAWTLIMIKWLGLALGRLEPWLWSFGICLKWLRACTWKACILWAFGLWCWSCVYTFDGLKWWASNDSRNNFWFPYKVEFNHRPLGLSSFIAYKNNYDGLKHWTWVIMVQTTAKQMHNEMQFTWIKLKVGSMGHYNMGRR